MVNPVTVKIVSSQFTTPNSIVADVEETILTVTGFTTTTGQRLKIDYSTEIQYAFTAGLLGATVTIFMRLYRGAFPGGTLLIEQRSARNYTASLAVNERYILANTFVDAPPAGTTRYTVTIEISVNGSAQNGAINILFFS